jgi:hypothetical protein
MTSFEGTHTHALTNTLFSYSARFVEHDDRLDFTASLKLGDKVVDELHGSAADEGFPAGTDPAIRVMHRLHRQIDAKDYGQRSNLVV